MEKKYSTLADVVASSSHTTWNVFGVVVSYSFPRACSPSARNKFSSSFLIVDQSIDFPVSIVLFGNNLGYFPSFCSVGDIVRCHRVRSQKYKDSIQLIGNIDAFKSSFLVCHRAVEYCDGQESSIASTGCAKYHMGLSDEQWYVLPSFTRYSFSPDIATVVLNLHTWSRYKMWATSFSEKNANQGSPYVVSHISDFVSTREFESFDRCDFRAILCKVEMQESFVRLYLWDGSTHLSMILDLLSQFKTLGKDRPFLDFFFTLSMISSSSLEHILRSFSTAVSIRSSFENLTEAPTEEHMAQAITKAKSSFRSLSLDQCLGVVVNLSWEQAKLVFGHLVKKDESCRFDNNSSAPFGNENADFAPWIGAWLKFRNVSLINNIRELDNGSMLYWKQPIISAESSVNVGLSFHRDIYAVIPSTIEERNEEEPCATSLPSRKSISPLGDPYTPIALIITSYAPCKYCFLASVVSWWPTNVKDFVTKNSSSNQSTFLFSLRLKDDTAFMDCIFTGKEAESILGLTAEGFEKDIGVQRELISALEELIRSKDAQYFYVLSYYTNPSVSNSSESQRAVNSVPLALENIKRYRQSKGTVLRFKAFRSSLSQIIKNDA